MTVHPPRVEFYRHHLGEAEKAAVADVLDSLFLTTGPRVRQLEDELAKMLGVQRVVAVSSCSNALMLALAAMDIGPGDEVVTTAATFIATANAIIWRDATPVLVDAEATTGNISVDAVEQAITARTRAILPVHLYGQMCDMPRLRQVADEVGACLIEDAAHCVEGRWHDVGPGQGGDAACFSFYATKNLTCGEGGAIATNDGGLADRLLELRMLGMSKGAADRYSARTYVHWDMPQLGYKANLSDIQAALLLAQLSGVEQRLGRREEIARVYEEALAPLPGIGFPRVLPGCRSARHMFTIWIAGDLRDRFLTDMGEAGIGVAVNYRPVHLMRYYRERFGYQPGMFPVAEAIGAQTASLPMYPSLRDAEVQRVVQTVGAWAEANRRELETTVATEPGPLGAALAPSPEHSRPW